MNLQFPELMRTQPYVDGRWVQCGRSFAVNNPADGGKVADVGDADVPLAESALEAAAAAFPAWRDRTAAERCRLLHRWCELIVEHQEDLALIITTEQGKPLAEARAELANAWAFVEWFAEEGKRVYGETIPAPGTDRRIVVIRQPVGVVAALTPWNFPSSMITRKAAPALAVGCTFVLRPASATPLSALALAKLADMAGIPAGVFNVVPSSASQAIGRLFTESPRVAKFSFTGSTTVGRQLMARCASTVKRVSLELGGNAPFLVFDDADLDAAVAGAMASKYRNAGQTCICANRFFVQRSVQDAFADRLAAAVKALKVGPGTAAGVDIGPLISTEALQDVDALVRQSVAAGATLVCGGRPHALGGTFYEPTILKGVSNDMPIAVNEIFGPVSPLIVFDTEAEAVQLANDTPYGLASYCYARDIGRIWRVAEGLEYGMVGINEAVLTNASAPFGGVKQSGLGREGSRYGLDEYLEIKYLCLGGMQQ